MIRHVMYTYRAKWWHMAQGMASSERERNKRMMGTDMLLTGVQRARPRAAILPSLPLLPAVGLGWVGAAELSSPCLLFYLSISFFLSFFVFFSSWAGRIFSLFFLSSK